MAYLRSHPEARQLTLIIAEDGSELSISGHEETTLPDGIRVLNGVPLFPEVPNMTPVTVEVVKQLLDEENALAD